VVTARIVSRVLSLSGLDRLVSIYPSLEGAMAASRAPAAVPASAGPGTDQRTPSRPAGRRRAEVPAAWRPEENGAIVPTATVRKLVDALQDGVALADGDGTIALASRRLEEMFGYAHAELPGHLVESLMPASQAADPGYWASYLKAPRTRSAGAGRRLAGLRKNGTTFPAEISLSPVTTAGGRFTMVVIRDITGALRLGDLADQARAAITAELEHRDREPADSIISGLFHVGLSLQAAMDQPADAAREHIAAAVGYLDETIREVRDTAFTARGRGTAST
jgi:PAS domain S-box-containing protein